MLTIEKTMKVISYWPPYLATGIRVQEYNLDEGYIVTRLKRTPFNGNAFGTHFGGSLYSMCDPWYVFLAVHFLGRNYIVWDVGAEIRFVKALKEPVYAKFSVTQDEIQQIRDKTTNGRKYLANFKTDVRSKSGEVVAEVSKTIYVREKR